MYRRAMTHRLINLYLLAIVIGGVIVASHSAKYVIPLFISSSLFVALASWLFVCTQRLKTAVVGTSLLFLSLALFNQLKVYYYKDQLMFEDLYLLIDPSNIETLAHYYGAGAAIVGLLVVVIITLYLAGRVELRGVRREYHLSALVLAVATTVAFGFLVTHPQNTERWEAHLPKGHGVVANISLSFFAQRNYQPPKFTADSNYFRQQFAGVSLQREPSKPDIIVLLQESTVNPQIYRVGVSTPPVPALPMFAATNTVKAHGPMRVQTFGGGTWLSEFALLTGLVSDDFGSKKSAVYYSVVQHLQYSLFKELKNNGYYTVVLSPFNKSAYHAGAAYQLMGVDEILQPQDLGHPASKNQNLWDISTAEIYHYIQEILRRKTDKPLFIFALTMYEHGPYESSYAQNYHFSDIKDQAQSGKMNHYISKISALSQATVDFNRFVIQRNKPTLFVSFGDHQPGILWENGYHLTLHRPEYVTQFILLDNIQDGFVLPPQKITDLSFLGGLILERAGLTMSEFYRANIGMRHLCQGALEDCPDRKLVESYKSYLYGDLQAASK